MKTNLFKKSQENQNSELLKMSKEELRTIEGGVWYMIRRADGTIGFVWGPEEAQ